MVVLTSSSSPDDVALAYSLNANSYVVKPRDYDELTRVMKALEDYWFEAVRLPDGGPRHSSSH